LSGEEWTLSSDNAITRDIGSKFQDEIDGCNDLDLLEKCEDPTTTVGQGTAGCYFDDAEDGDKEVESKIVSST
jgi:hypothetical protein